MTQTDYQDPNFKRDYVFKNLEKPFDSLLIKSFDSLETIAAIPYIITHRFFNQDDFRKGYLKGANTTKNGIRENMVGLWASLALRFRETKEKGLISFQQDIIQAAHALKREKLFLSDSETKVLTEHFPVAVRLLFDEIAQPVRIEKQSTSLAVNDTEHTRV